MLFFEEKLPMYSWLIGAASPFATWEEFEGAIDGPTGGAIYTFADRPALLGIATVVAALIFIYFIYASFNIKSGDTSAEPPQALGLLLVAGAASAMASLYEGFIEQKTPQQVSRPGQVAQVSKTSRSVPAALLGMTGLVGVAPKRKRSKTSRRRLLNR
jgi:hypothetical protein